MTAMMMPRAGRDCRPAPPPNAAPAPLRSLLYVSSASRALSAHELASLVAEARAWNAANGITGVLLYRRGNFIQYLEGPCDRIDALHRRIRRDARHHGVVPILDHRIAERAFAEQPLKFEDLDAAGATDCGRLETGFAGLPGDHPPAPPNGDFLALRILDRFRQHHHLRRARSLAVCFS